MWQSSQEIIGNARDINAGVRVTLCDNSEFWGLCWLNACVRNDFGGRMVLRSGCCWLREKDIVSRSYVRPFGGGGAYCRRFFMKRMYIV